MNKIKENKGVTLVTLIVTFWVLTIIAGISIGMVINAKGSISETNESLTKAQKESLLEKIEADLYTEKVKRGQTPNEEDLINLINDNNYGNIKEKNGEKVLINTDEKNAIEVEIPFSEIVGWENN